MLYAWLVLLFLLGAAFGSFLNVCVYRLPLEKSIVWPGSHCGHCFQPIRWYDNIPLVSYWLLRGRCRVCGTKFSLQYFALELFTALSFVGLFYLVVVVNVHQFELLRQEELAIQLGFIPWQAWVIFAHHAVLLCFLIVATVCDLRERWIPLSVTLPGAAVGLVSAVLWPWPWPYDPVAVARKMSLPFAWTWPRFNTPPQGLYPWPAWGPLPDWLAPGGNWQTGLLTGLAGLLAGTIMLRGIRFVFSKGMGVEALGLGDADIMMMAGCFVGWQPVVVAFFVAVLPALVLGVLQVILTGDNAVPFGPSLAVGVLVTWLAWAWIGPQVQFMFFTDWLLLALVLICTVFLILASLVLRLLRRLRGVT